MDNVLVRLFELPRHICECGHNKDYHLGGGQNASLMFVIVKTLEEALSVKRH